MSKFIPFCPCCQSYNTDDKHQNHCLLGHAEQHIAELKQIIVDQEIHTGDLEQHITEMEQRLAAAEAKIPRWIPVSERLPPLGVKVDIMLGGVVQDETYELEKEDDDWGLGKYFWSRDDLDECPSVNWENDMWMPRPKAQQVEGER